VFLWSCGGVAVVSWRCSEVWKVDFYVQCFVVLLSCGCSFCCGVAVS